MSKNEKLELRNTSSPVQICSGGESRTVEGYAILFGTSSDGLPFEEIIERGALDGVIEASDVFALMNHDRSRGVLARCKKGAGSLTLHLDDKGLMYRFEAPNTALGDELLENIRRGEVEESSFCFEIGEENWQKRSDGVWKRSIKRVFRLHDVSPVYNAAYSKTSVYMRGCEQAEAELQKIENEQRAIEEYYTKIQQSFNI